MTAFRSLFALLLLAPASLWAATIALAPGEVAVAANGQCSLIEAIHNANADAQVDNGDCAAGSGADTLLLPVEGFMDYVLQQPDAANADNGLPLISSAITIDAPAPGVIRRFTAACNRNGTADPGEFRLIEVVSGGSLTLRNLTLSNGCADGSGPRNDGGAIRVNGGATLDVHRVRFSSNNAHDKSGAIDVSGNATVTISTSIFQANRADGGAGAIGNGSSTVIIDSSAFSINNAGGDGGGAIGNLGVMHLRNSTVSNNTTTSNGGGIGNGNGGTLVIEFSTLVDNSASGALGGGGIGNVGTLQIKNSIVADNGAGGDCVNLGTFEALGENFDSSGSCAAIDPDFVQVTLAALNLGSLSNNTGFTLTHLPGAGSAAIDAVSDCTGVDGLTVYERDQRDLPRPWDGDGQNGAQCDVGSVEVIPLGSEQIVVDGVSCTLGDAIEAANSSQTVGGCANALFGSDTLILNAPVLLTGADTLRSTEREGAFAALPDLTSPISIEPGTHRRIERDPGLDCVSADGPNEFRLFNVVAEGELRLEDVELANGCADRGGAVLVADAALLALERDDTGVRLIGNTARSTALSAQGGAIWIDSSGQSEINGARFENNRAIGRRAAGGALWEDSGLTVISASRFIANQALAIGSDSSNRMARGGAARVGAPAMSELVFEDNQAQGEDRTVGDGGPAVGGALDIAFAGASITDAWFVRNAALGGDGARGGYAYSGAVHAEATTHFLRTTFESNLAAGGEGSSSSGGSGWAGAVYAYRNSSFDHATFADNEARGGNSTMNIGADAYGGALYLEPDPGEILQIRHSTFAGNRVVGGLGPSGDGAPTGGGLQTYEDGSVQIFASLLEGNTATVGASTTPSVCFQEAAGVVASLGFNTLAESSPDCAFGEATDQTAVGHSLIPLGDYGCVETLPGGACLPTHPVRVGRPAQDAASCASGATEDARGASRPWDDPNVVNTDDGCDAGAYESRDVDNDGFDDDSIGIHDDGFE